MKRPVLKSTLLSVYPNPSSASDIMNLDVFSVSAGESMSIVIRDLPGRELYRQTAELVKGSNRVTLSMPKPELRGIFFIEVSNPGFREIRKLIIK